jgi:hypothetical protein
MTFYENTLESYIADVCTELADKVVWRLQRLKSTMSGADSGLTNVWDELCVQAQGEQSAFYDLYLDTAEKMIQALLREMSPHLQALLWLETEEGRELRWMDEDDTPDLAGIWVEAEVAQYILQEYVLQRAADYTNKKIENYIYR